MGDGVGEPFRPRFVVPNGCENGGLSTHEAAVAAMLSRATKRAARRAA
jgi:hypothetical protein